MAVPARAQDPCGSLQLSSDSFSIPAQGGSANLTITALDTCGWALVEVDSFLPGPYFPLGDDSQTNCNPPGTFPSCTGTGTLTIDFTAPANQTPSIRYSGVCLITLNMRVPPDSSSGSP